MIENGGNLEDLETTEVEKTTDVAVLDLVVSKQQFALIEFNEEEINKALDKMLTLFKDVDLTTLSDNELTAFKNDLGRLSSSIDNKRKEIKKTHEQPIKAFEAKVKTLKAKVDEAQRPAVEAISKKEQQRKVQKNTEIEALYDDYTIEFNPKWLNKGFAMKDIIAEIEQQKLKTDEAVAKKAREVEMVKNHIEAMNKAYGKSLDYSSYEFLMDFIEVSQVMEKITKDASEVVAVKKVVIEKTIDDIFPNIEPVDPFTTVEVSDPFIEVERTYKVTATAAKIDKLVEYMAVNGIKWEVL